MQALIIGASGYLGKHIYTYFSSKYNKVIGTYHSHQADKSMIHFDINEDNIERISVFLEEEMKCAILCAAEAKLDNCKMKEKESFLTNVTSMIKLIEKLKQMNYYIIFCSTDNVYDGGKGNYRETDLANPVNEYGKMKLLVEQYITQNYPDICIFRLSKVVGDVYSPKDIFLEWKRKAENKEDIYCIKDNYFSLADVEDVVACMELACNKKLCGIYNVCGNEIFNRMDLCIEFLHTLGLETYVYEKAVEEFGFRAARPLNIGMSNQKVREALGYRFHAIEEVFMRYIDI